MPSRKGARPKEPGTPANSHGRMYGPWPGKMNSVIASMSAQAEEPEASSSSEAISKISVKTEAVRKKDSQNSSYRSTLTRNDLGTLDLLENGSKGRSDNVGQLESVPNSELAVEEHERMDGEAAYPANMSKSRALFQRSKAQKKPKDSDQTKTTETSDPGDNDFIPSTPYETFDSRPRRVKAKKPGLLIVKEKNKESQLTETLDAKASGQNSRPVKARPRKLKPKVPDISCYGILPNADKPTVTSKQKAPLDTKELGQRLPATRPQVRKGKLAANKRPIQTQISGIISDTAGANARKIQPSSSPHVKGGPETSQAHKKATDTQDDVYSQVAAGSSLCEELETNDFIFIHSSQGSHSDDKPECDGGCDPTDVVANLSGTCENLLTVISEDGLDQETRNASVNAKDVPRQGADLKKAAAQKAANEAAAEKAAEQKAALEAAAGDEVTKKTSARKTAERKAAKEAAASEEKGENTALRKAAEERSASEEAARVDKISAARKATEERASWEAAVREEEERKFAAAGKISVEKAAEERRAEEAAFFHAAVEREVLRRTAAMEGANKQAMKRPRPDDDQDSHRHIRHRLDAQTQRHEVAPQNYSRTDHPANYISLLSSAQVSGNPLSDPFVAPEMHHIRFPDRRARDTAQAPYQFDRSKDGFLRAFRETMMLPVEQNMHNQAGHDVEREHVNRLAGFGTSNQIMSESSVPSRVPDSRKSLELSPMRRLLHETAELLSLHLLSEERTVRTVIEDYTRAGNQILTSTACIEASVFQQAKGKYHEFCGVKAKSFNQAYKRVSSLDVRLGHLSMQVSSGQSGALRNLRALVGDLEAAN